MNPFDYGCLDQTVTIYRQQNGEVFRTVAENCYFAPQMLQKTTMTGKSGLKKFLLIIPGEMDLRPGDRVCEGLGPEQVDWHTFLPDLLSGVFEIDYVKPCIWEGQVCHIRAGQ